MRPDPSHTDRDVQRENMPAALFVLRKECQEEERLVLLSRHITRTLLPAGVAERDVGGLAAARQQDVCILLSWPMYALLFVVHTKTKCKYFFRFSTIGSKNEISYIWLEVQ